VRAPAALFAVVLAAACAPALTPQQAQTWDAFKACQAQGPSTILDRVEPNGRAHLFGREGEVFKVGTCIDEYRRKAGAPATVRVTPAPSKPNAFVVLAPPAWSTGDEWRFSGQGPGAPAGEYTLRVDREETLEGVTYYVLKSGKEESLYRKSDLAAAGERLDGALVYRSIPPRLLFVWPLAVGARWEQTHRSERPTESQVYDSTYTAAVEAEETVTVPAGTFRTLKVVARYEGQTVVWEYWYAPEVRWWVRVVFRKGDGRYTHELLNFRSAARAAARR
jgi:hypothetical protein